MLSQITPTPTVRGSQAEKIYAEANRKLSTESKNGAKNLESIFNHIMRGYWITQYRTGCIPYVCVVQWDYIMRVANYIKRGRYTYGTQK